MYRYASKKNLLLLFFFLSIVLTPICGLFYFAYINDAPILKGGIDYKLPYNDKQSLDIYTPTTELYERSPVLIYFHGGGWVTGRKEALNLNRFNSMFNHLREQGYTIISPSYTLGKKSQSPFPECVKDVFEAIEWVYTRSDSLKLDTTNMGVMGESAGAHLGLMALFSSPQNFDLKTEKRAPDYLIDVYGPTDLWSLYYEEKTDSNSSVWRFRSALKNDLKVDDVIFGFDPNEDSTRTKSFTDTYSPLNYIDSNDLGVKLLIVHGAEDHIVPIDQSYDLQNKLDQFSISHTSFFMKNVDHAFIHATKEQMDSLQTAVSDYVIAHYNKAERLN